MVKPKQQRKRKPKFGPKLPPNMAAQRRVVQRAGNRPITIGNKLVGFGDYSEAKGRKLYDKRKAKKRSGGGGGWWKTLKSVGETVGPLLGKAAMTALTGFGDYTVDTNSVSAAATDGKLGGQIPIVENSHCTNIIRHKEYLGPVNGNTIPFGIEAEYPINPGLVKTFPWLANIANCYTRYRLRGAVVCYEPLASDYTTAGSLGFVAIGTQYNPLDPVFTNKIDMLNHEFSSECKPSKSMVHPIECAKSQMSISEYFLRSEDPPAGADLRFYDLGKITIATGGNPVTTQIGDLWITYEVELYQPRLNETARGSPESIYYAGTGIDGTHLLGTESVRYNSFPGTSITAGVSVPNLLYFPPNAVGKYYLVCWHMRTNGGVILINIGTDVMSAVGCSKYTISRSGEGTISTSYSQVIIVKVTSIAATIQFTTAAAWSQSAGTNTCGFQVTPLAATIGSKFLALLENKEKIPKNNGWMLTDDKPVPQYVPEEGDTSSEDELEMRMDGLENGMARILSLLDALNLQSQRNIKVRLNDPRNETRSSESI